MEKNWQKIRLFVSLTLTRKREDYLYQYCFPELYSWCEKWQFDLAQIKFLKNTDGLPVSVTKFAKEEFIFVWLAKSVKFAQKEPSIRIFCRNVELKDINLQTLSKYICNDFTNTISEHFPQHLSLHWKNTNSKWSKLYNAQQAFIFNRLRFVVKRENLLCEIQKYIKNYSSKMLVIYGAEGSGKSTLLASLYREICKKHFTIIHFVGVGIKGAQRDYVIEKLCYEIEKIYKIKSMENAHLYQRWRNLLEKITKKTVIVIDGLEYLEPLYDQTFSWLPRKLTPFVKVIVSITEKRELLADANVLQMENLTISESIAIAEQVKHKASRSYQFAHENAIELAFTPLELQIILQENFSNKDVQKLFSTNKKTPELFYRLLLNIEEQWKSIPDLVETLFSILGSMRYGISPKELQELLLGVDEEDIHQTILFRLYQQIFFDGELYKISCFALKQAIDKLYLNKNSLSWHCYLGNYFMGQPSTIDGHWNLRKLQELCWHLTYGEMFKEATTILCDLQFLKAKVTANLAMDLLDDFRRLLDVLPQDFEVEIAAQVYIDREVIKWLENFFIKLVGKVWGIDHHDICRHPLWLFQTLWNVGFWYDSPKAKKFYKELHRDPNIVHKEKIYRLAEYWRQKIETKGQIWIQSQLPFLANIYSPTQSVFICKETYVVAFSQDGSKAAIDFGETNTIKVVDTKNKEPIYFFSYDRHEPREDRHLFFSICGKKLVFQAPYNTWVWNLQNGTLCFHQSTFVAIAISPDAKKVIEDAGDSKNLVVDKKIVDTFTGSACQFYFSENSQILAYWALSKIHVKNTTTANLLSTIPMAKYFRLSPNGKKIVFFREAIYIWDVVHSKKTALTYEHFPYPKGIKFAFSSNSELVAIGYRDAKIWETATGKLIEKIDTDMQWVHKISFSSDSKKVIIVFRESWQMLDLTTKRSHFYTRKSSSILELSSNGSHIAYAGTSTNNPLLELFAFFKIEFLEEINFTLDGSKIFIKYFHSTNRWELWDIWGNRLATETQGKIKSQDGRLAIKRKEGSFWQKMSWSVVDLETGNRIFESKNMLEFRENGRLVVEIKKGKEKVVVGLETLQKAEDIYQVENKENTMVVTKQGKEVAHFPFTLEKVQVVGNVIVGCTKINDKFSQIHILHIKKTSSF